MIHVVRPIPTQARAAMRSAPIASSDWQRPHSARRWPGGNPMDDPSILDEEFDEMGCEVPTLLRIVNQP